MVVQIEDPEPLDELEAIAATPGIDMLLAPAISATGSARPANGVIRNSWTRAAAWPPRPWPTAIAGTVASPANLDELVSMGYRFLAVGRMWWAQRNTANRSWPSSTVRRRRQQKPVSGTLICSKGSALSRSGRSFATCLPSCFLRGCQIGG